MSKSSDSDKTIKEQFRDRLLDGVLRREVKRTLMAEPNIKFIKLRDRALDLADDDLLIRRRRQGRKINTYHTEVDSQILGALEGLTTALRDQTGTLESVKLRQENFYARLQTLEQSKTKTASELTRVKLSAIDVTRRATMPVSAKLQPQFHVPPRETSVTQLREPGSG